MSDELHPHDPNLPPGAIGVDARLASIESKVDSLCATSADMLQRMERGSERHASFRQELDAKADKTDLRELREDLEVIATERRDTRTWATRLVIGGVVSAVLVAALSLLALGAAVWVGSTMQHVQETSDAL